MIIALFGMTGSGKNTVGELIAKELSFNVVAPTFKDLAAKEGITLLEFQKKAQNDPNIDKKFDNALKEMANTQDSVVVTWLGPWMLECDFRVGLNASLETRIARTAKREGISVEKAREFVIEKDEGNKKRYKKVYGIDIENQSKFDIWVNTEKFNPKQIAKIIVDSFKVKCQKTGEKI